MTVETLEEAVKEGIRKSLGQHFKERRDKLEIISDILSVTTKGANKTEIVYQANLNFTRIGKFIPFLEERELIENSGSQYLITEKGKQFLQEYQNIMDLLVR